MVKDASEHFFALDQVRPYDTDLVIDKRQPRHLQVDGGQGRQFEYWSKGGMNLSRPKGKISSDIVRVGRASASHKIGRRGQALRVIFAGISEGASERRGERELLGA